jgi:hypothetical protein
MNAMPMSGRIANPTSGSYLARRIRVKDHSRMTDNDADLRGLLETLAPKARDHLRRVLIRDHADRDAISSRLMRYRDDRGRDWADIIDFLTMHPDARRQLARLLAEADARGRGLG